MAASGLSYRNPLVGIGWAISLLRMNGLKTICPCEAPISGIEALYYIAPISTSSAGSNVGLVKVYVQL